MTQSFTSSRRTVLAGAFGISTLGGAGLTTDAAAAAVGDVTIPDDPGTYYLSLTSIAGDVVVRNFEGQVSLLTWGWGVTNPTDPSAGTGSGAARPVPGDFIAVAYTSIHSPPVTGYVNTGKRIATAKLSCAKNGEQPFTYLTLTLSNVLVSSHYCTPDVTSARPLDVFHLRYTKMSQSFVPQRADGTAGTAVTTSFDYAKGA